MIFMVPPMFFFLAHLFMPHAKDTFVNDNRETTYSESEKQAFDVKSGS